MIKIPYNFPGETKFQDYSTIVNRIEKFDSHRILGADESGQYNIYEITLGNSNNPTLFFTATMHGTEWQGTQYLMSFLEQLRDNTFPDKTLRSNLLDDFHISAIPVLNPWGLEETTPHAILKGRYNFNGKDLNRDFFEFTQSESRIARDAILEHKPFAYFDFHMIRGHLRDKFLIVGNGQTETEDIRDEWAESWESYSGYEVERWKGYQSLNKGLSRRFVRDQPNDYTPHTLSYITEMGRPVEEAEGFHRPLTDREIFKFGMASIYLFFKTSLEYFNKYNKSFESVVNRTMYVRDLEGKEYMLQATTTHEFELNGNQHLSFDILPTKANSLFIDDISEMWEVIDNDQVTHKIVQCNRRGKGNRLTVEIKAVPLFFDELNNSRIYEESNKHMTAQAAFSRIFEDTRFDFIIVGNFDAVEWEGFGGGESRLETFKRALERYKMEFRIVGNIVYLEHQIGRDTQFMYRHKLNATNIVQEVDANELWTYAKGYGNYGNEGEGEGGTSEWQDAKLIREYTSPLADVIGKREAPPIKDGRITNTDTMDKQLKQLVDESLKISINADIHDLRKQGYALAQPRIGDRVFIIDERIGLDEEIRITQMSVTKDWKGNVLDINMTIGSEGLSKRYQSNLNTATKEITDLIEGRKNLPFSVLDEAVKNATKALQNAQTELIFGNHGIIARDKNDPNLLTILNSAGVGVSDDGGATFRNAITGEGINASTIFTGTMVADFIAGGTLSSLNDNMNFDLNAGDLYMDKASFTMRNANFYLGGGANIVFEDPGNKIYYSILGPNTYYRTSGMGVGRVLDNDLPFAYIGTTPGGDLDTLDPGFSGLMTHTTYHINNGAANSISGRRFAFRDKAIDWVKGVSFDFFGNNPTISTMASTEYDYIIGEFFRMYVKQDFSIRNYYNKTSGWMMETNYSGEGRSITFGGLSTQDYNYQLGRSSHPFLNTFTTNVYAKRYLQPSSAEDKKNIKELSVTNSMELINHIEPKLYHYLEDEVYGDDYWDFETYRNMKAGFMVEDIQNSIALYRNLLLSEDETELDTQNIVAIIWSATQHINIRVSALEETKKASDNEITTLKQENTMLKERVRQLEESA